MTYKVHDKLVKTQCDPMWANWRKLSYCHSQNLLKLHTLFVDVIPAAAGMIPEFGTLNSLWLVAQAVCC